MTTAEALTVLKKHIVYGNTPEFLAKVTRNGYLIQRRNYEGTKDHLTYIGGAVPIDPSDVEETDWIGFRENPETILANSL